MNPTDTPRKLLRLGLVTVALIQFLAWTFRPLLNDLMPHQAPGNFELLFGLVFSVPYLLALGLSLRRKSGTTETAAGAAIAFGLVNLSITVFLTRQTGPRQLLLGAAETLLLALGLTVAANYADRRRTIIWTLWALTFLLAWYMAVAVVLATHIKSWT